MPRESYRTARDTLSSLLLRHTTRGEATPPSWIWAIDEVSFDVPISSVMGIIGRNGSGKTTLLKVLARITRPTRGEAIVRGRVGSLLEVGTGFHPELTGRENVFLSGALLGMSHASIRDNLDAIIDFSGVETFIDQPLKRFSSGMQLRLAFAVAAHLEPEILFVDEVLAVGDLEFQRKCLGKMEEASRGGRTILLVSHQMSQIRRLCPTCVWLDRGRVRQIGDTASVVAAYESAQTDTSAEPSHGASVEFLRWTLLDNGAPTGHRHHDHGPLVLAVDIRVRTTIRRGEYGITLFDGERRAVWSEALYGLHLEPGDHRIEHRLSGLPVRPGVYAWQPGLFDGADWTVWWASPELQVDTSYLTQQRREAYMGLLNLNAELNVTSSAVQ